MKIVEPSFEILASTPNLEQLIELAGRVCYKSEDKIAEKSYSTFIKRLRETKHESVLEHGSITVKFVVDRGVSHELVRHRIASFSQESTRYCNYSKDKFGNELSFVKPVELLEKQGVYLWWKAACEDAEGRYLAMILAGISAQTARSVLPNCLKTEIVVTANPREWMHIFKMRCDKTAHPDMRFIMCKCKNVFAETWPSIFGEVEK